MSVPDVLRPRVAPQQIKPCYVVIDPMILGDKLKEAVFSSLSPNGQSTVMGELPETLQLLIGLILGRTCRVKKRFSPLP